MAFEIPLLPYEYSALEPYIDEATMQIHHDKHHGAYVEKLNAALEGQDNYSNRAIEELLEIIKELPDDLQTAIRNNGGGHANHSLFWEIMAPKGRMQPQGALDEAILETFGNFETFAEKFTSLALGRFGSGWAWLVVKNGSLALEDTANQDSPLMEGKTPILCLDVWEHAYYLKYQNRRADYVKAWWNVVNWPKVEELFAIATS